MSKITFRADEELVDRLERFDASKSEVMRQALRAYLDEHEGNAAGDTTANPSATDVEGTLDALVAERVDAVLSERLDDYVDGGQDLDLTISLVGAEDATVREGRPRQAREGSGRRAPAEPSDAGATESSAEAADEERTCGQCGATVAPEHVYCPNCGEKATRRVFCDCGDELRSDWAFCPACGRRTPAADVLDGS